MTLRAISSDWIEVDVADALADGFVEAALAVNLPTAEPGPPPVGTDLERRRRFH